MSDPTAAELGGLVRRGLAWSAASNLLLRFGTVAVGIALARLLSPEEFGVYAVALTVQAVLMTFADLGLAAGLIVSDDPDRDAPTVAAIALAAGVLASLGMLAVAGTLAGALGSPDSAPAIRMLAVTLLLAGAGVVPYALLQRRFAQRALFWISVTDFLLSSVVTLALVAAGWGVISLAIGRVVAQSVALVLQYAVAGVRPRIAVDADVVGPVLRFGIPVAATTLLSWLVLNVDNVVIARVAGPVELGFYVLAFNIAMWPMSALGQVIRSVSLPAFARSRDLGDDSGVLRALSIAWAFALPAGACLAVLAVPLVTAVYGETWTPAASVVTVLGVFGGVRVLFDLAASYLLARGRSGRVLWVQAVWCLALVPVLVLATRAEGAVGAGWAHLVVGLGVVAPLYTVALRSEGLALRRLAGAVWRPVVACVPATVAGWAVVERVSEPWSALGLGLLSGAVLYFALAGSWIWRLTRSAPADANAAPATVPSQVGA